MLWRAGGAGIFTPGGGGRFCRLFVLYHTHPHPHTAHTPAPKAPRARKCPPPNLAGLTWTVTQTSPLLGGGWGGVSATGNHPVLAQCTPPPGVETTATPRGRFCARHSDSVYQKRLCITCITSKNFGHHLCRVHHQQEFCAALCVLSEKLYITCVPPTKVLCITTKL